MQLSAMATIYREVHVLYARSLLYRAMFTCPSYIAAIFLEAARHSHEVSVKGNTIHLPRISQEHTPTNDIHEATIQTITL